MFIIMKTIPSYRVEHFFDDRFMASQYFTLIDLIKEDVEAQKEMHEEAEKERKKKNK